MEEFRFHTKADQTILLGIRAATVGELLEGMRIAPPSSIYFHTHHFLQQHHFLSPEPPNDFAYWVTEVLTDAALGEALSSVDVVQFHQITSLQRRFIDILTEHEQGKRAGARAPDGHEFHFMASRTFVFETPFVASTLEEFQGVLRRISISSIYYHMFDAKLRLERGENDFSRWFTAIGRPDLAGEVKRLDPYTHTLEGLRKRLLVIAKSHDGH
jgi:hypothetical protein